MCFLISSSFSRAVSDKTKMLPLTIFQVFMSSNLVVLEGTPELSLLGAGLDPLDLLEVHVFLDLEQLLLVNIVRATRWRLLHPPMNLL